MVWLSLEVSSCVSTKLLACCVMWYSEQVRVYGRRPIGLLQSRVLLLKWPAPRTSHSRVPSLNSEQHSTNGKSNFSHFNTRLVRTRWMTGRSACSPSVSLHHQSAVARFAHSNPDGGGIRGLSELVVLEEIMNRIKYDLDLDGDLLPADFFDLIGGTSTGG